MAPSVANSQSRNDHVYVDHLYGWSVSYPDNWTIDTLDQAFVQIHQPSTLPYGLVGIHSATALKGASLGDFADRMMASVTGELVRKTSDVGSLVDVNFDAAWDAGTPYFAAVLDRRIVIWDTATGEMKERSVGEEPVVAWETAKLEGKSLR